MKHTKYTGLFISDTMDKYSLDVYCNGFIQALFLLTADAIRSGKHYQLSSITNDKNTVRYVSNIMNTSCILS